MGKIQRRITLMLSLFFFVYASPRARSDNAVMHQAPSESSEQADQKVASKHAPVESCKPNTKPTIACAVGDKDLSELKCTDIFSPIAPSWLQNIPNLGVASSPIDWWPVCSHVRLRVYHILDPNMNLEHLVRDYSDRITGTSRRKSLDLCAVGSTALRGTSGYQAPAAADLGLKIMNEAQRKSLLDNYFKTSQQVIKACCQGFKFEESCFSAMRQIKTAWCKPEADPSRPDPCIEVGDYFEPNLFNLYFPPEDPLEPIVKGTVHLTPIVDQDGSPLTDMNVIAHELGHACSFVRRSLGGSRAQLQMKFRDTDEAKRCGIDSNTVQTYSKLWSDTQASSETFRCLHGLAKNAPFTRFVKGQCPGGCPQSYLEEAFADWIKLKSSPNAMLQPLVHTCLGLRDNQHPLGADIVACLLKTASVELNLKRAIECQ